MIVARGPVLLAALLLAGCGASPHAGDAPVRALMDRYLAAMSHRDWVQACAQLTPEVAQQRAQSTPAGDCPSSQAWDAGAGLAGDPHVHPERAGEEFTQMRVTRIDMLGDRALVHVHQPGSLEDVTLLAVRRQGTWLLAQDLEVGAPYDPGSGQFS
jgi:hypothetical protein